MIDLINSRRAAHVVTIEDPVEYQHVNRTAVIEQIEVGATLRTSRSRCGA
jgi:twitching motility protein PilT